MTLTIQLERLYSSFSSQCNSGVVNYDHRDLVIRLTTDLSVFVTLRIKGREPWSSGYGKILML